MLGHLSLKHFFIELLFVLIPALLCTFFLGHLFLWLFIFTLLLLFWHYRQIYRLSRWIWVEHSFYPPEGRGTWLPVLHGLLRMRLERRKERNRLLEFIRYFRKGAEAMPDATILCDKDGRLNWCNPQAERLLKLRWPQDEKQSIFHLIRTPEILAYFKKGAYEKPFLLKRGDRELECRFYYPYIENNLLIIARDVTDREMAERTRQMFFANVNHELRVPLTVLKGYVEMLEENLEAHEKNGFEGKAFARMDEQIDRLQMLAKQLMTLTRLETAPKADHFTAFNLSEIAQGLVHDYHHNHPDSHAFITADIPPHIECFGDSDQLKQVLNNLFYNAIEHNPANTPVHLVIAATPKQILVSVSDQGKGISALHLPKLTERFYRIDSSRNRDQSGGSGLGLAIVKHALHNHGSELVIKSVIDKGTTFSFALPRP